MPGGFVVVLLLVERHKVGDTVFAATHSHCEQACLNDGR